MLAILLLAVVLPCAYSLGVIVPLYYNPGGDCFRWSKTISAISGNSGTPFYVVINPGTQADSFYDACVPRLRPSSNPNATVLGYVNVASKSASSVLAEIDTYAGWNSSSRPTGIFFYGVWPFSSSQYRSFVSHAKDKGFSFIALDPTVPPNSDYYTLADLVNTYESSYSDFKTADLVISSSAPASKQSVMLGSAPVIGSYSAVISQLASLGFAAVYITDLETDVVGVPEQWSTFINDVVSVNWPSSANNPTNMPSSLSGASSSSQTSVRFSSTSPLGLSSLVASPSPPSTPTQTSSPDPTSGPASQSSSPVGAIVGGVLGAVILILLGLFFILWRRRRQSSPTDAAPVRLDPFLSRQPFTLIETTERPSPDTPHTMSDTEAGTSLPAPSGSTYVSSSSSPSSRPSASNYGGWGRGASEKRRPSVTGTFNRATMSSGDRHWFDPPPSYRPPSPAPV